MTAEAKTRATRTRRDNLQLAKDALPSLPVDQLAEVCEHLVHTSPRQALLLQTVLKEALDAVRPRPPMAGMSNRPERTEA